MTVYFDNRQEKFEITKQMVENLEKVVDAAIKVEEIHIPVEVSISFVNNDEIQQLNHDYRNKNIPTDVLSFPLIEREELDKHGKGQGEILLGDIIISIPKTIEQAKEYGHSFLRELAYLTVHGMFHLLGYDHLRAEEKVIMRRKEESVMENLQITRTLS